ncbi:hypothetical protein QJS04_geneDACA007286 [Acorus gramineus]|uniref:Uncharacterized protein n=1 Tax=Acorus gramineus TaxID=55184 RepID=A0AAV9BQZ6_ACOGR|nr:hypothetical protein QJS04_geneDACA007286 [Acorus gramineus]
MERTQSGGATYDAEEAPDAPGECVLRRLPLLLESPRCGRGSRCARTSSRTAWMDGSDYSSNSTNKNRPPLDRRR